MTPSPDWLVSPPLEAFKCLLGWLVRFVMFAQSFIMTTLFYLLEIIIRAITLIPSLSKYQPQLLASLPKINPDIYAKTEDFIMSHKEHTLEIHKIETEDGYILTAWRILPTDPTLNAQARSREPVMLVHGLMDCSISWFLNKQRHLCLPYILADQGFDVWVMNNRGNRYSLGHTSLKSIRDNFAYWQFSFDELAQYDCKANIQYVANTTGHPKVFYVGHSQGSTQLYAYLCSDLSLQSYIRAFIGLGPAVYIDHLDSKFVKTLFQCGVIDLFDTMGFGHFFHFPRSVSKRVGALCHYLPFIYKKGLFHVFKLLTGFNKVNQLPRDLTSMIVTHQPGGASVKNILHWEQFMRTGEFKKYDFGKEKNLKIYGTEQPPHYNVENLKNITIPQYLFFGSADIVSSKTDSQRLLDVINKENSTVFELEDFAHLDYIWGVNAHQKLYPEVIRILKAHPASSSTQQN